MAKTNQPVEKVHTHTGGQASHVSAHEELRRTVLTCLLWENTFYEGGDSIAKRIAALIPKCETKFVCALAIEARSRMQLRHAPLWLMRCAIQEYSKNPNRHKNPKTGSQLREALAEIIQRPDEMTEFLSLYWKDKRQPLAACVKKGLADAFGRFNAYSLAKYNQMDKAVKLRDVLFLTHPKPDGQKGQPELWKKLVDKTLESPDTWEVALSSGVDKCATFTRLLKDGKLGGLATLRNLRNMVESGVDEDLIRERLKAGCERALPFRFITAAKVVPQLEDAIESAMFAAAKDLEKLFGSTGLLIDVSGSMVCGLHGEYGTRNDYTNRIDVATGLAILVREKCEKVKIATFSTRVVELPIRRGFALRDAITNSQEHRDTFLKGALELLRSSSWQNLDRIIVITDEQSQDGCATAWTPNSYIVNVASYVQGVGYEKGWTHINGWSERVLDYIQFLEETKG